MLPRSLWFFQYPEYQLVSLNNPKKKKGVSDSLPSLNISFIYLYAIPQTADPKSNSFLAFLLSFSNKRDKQNPSEPSRGRNPHLGKKFQCFQPGVSKHIPFKVKWLQGPLTPPSKRIISSLDLVNNLLRAYTMPHIQILGQSLERCFPCPTKNEHQPRPVHEGNVIGPVYVEFSPLWE